MKRGFTPKEFNEGGRKQLTDLMYNHHQAILKARPTIKNSAPVSLKAPIHNDKKKPVNLLKKEEFNEVFEAFRRAEKAKAKRTTVDNRAPDSLKLKNMLASKGRKNESFQQQEHERNLKIQMEHIKNTGKSMMERKKNKFDPVAHPSYFFRAREESRTPITVEYLARKLMADNYISPLEQDIAKEPRTAKIEVPQTILPDSKVHANPEEGRKYRRLKTANADRKHPDHSKNLSLSRLNSAGARLSEGGLVPVPQVDGKEDEDYEALKVKLVHLIVDYRIIKTDDLNSLFGRTMIYNRHLDPMRLEDLFNYIKEEFDK